VVVFAFEGNLFSSEFLKNGAGVTERLGGRLQSVGVLIGDAETPTYRGSNPRPGF